MELGAVVPGDRLERQAARADQLNRGAGNGAHRAVRQADDHAKASRPLHQRQKAAALTCRAHDGVALPVTNLLPALDRL